MKKLFVMLIALALCLGMTVFAEETPERTAATEFVYELTSEESVYVQNMIFDETVTIRGDESVIFFNNCEFNADIRMESETGTRVFLMPDCVVNGKCVLASGVSEATMEVNFPKFMVFMPVEVVSEESFGSAVVLGDFPVVYDGVTYTLADATVFFDITAPENGLVPYEDQQANLFVVAQWRENGERQILIECEYDPTL